MNPSELPPSKLLCPEPTPKNLAIAYNLFVKPKYAEWVKHNVRYKKSQEDLDICSVYFLEHPLARLAFTWTHSLGGYSLSPFAMAAVAKVHPNDIIEEMLREPEVASLSFCNATFLPVVTCRFPNYGGFLVDLRGRFLPEHPHAPFIWLDGTLPPLAHLDKIKALLPEMWDPEDEGNIHFSGNPLVDERCAVPERAYALLRASYLLEELPK